ncbi:hypothetical protein DF185_16315 [Marinifilum breve]|uniref:histidine kinase n=1 Tax=Marinifilum breve TaxID=2184082 RepID=A0A2V3ZXL4_9BACT|nr:PocR ligand-binding domain-containing protein [Marinifilum breve]PXX98935.1 hypothetical protein DF185_16315 [Marinifilum breve]
MKGGSVRNQEEVGLESNLIEEKYSIEGLIDVPVLQELMEYFHKVTQIPVGILSPVGEVYVAIGWQDACLNFHRKGADSCKMCVESDLYIAENLDKGKQISYQCWSRLQEVGVPVFVGEQHVASVMLGQFFYEDEEIDYSFYKRIAEKYGYDEQSYLEAIERIPRFSKERVKDIMSFYSLLAESISRKGLVAMQLRCEIMSRKEAYGHLKESKEKLDALINSISSPIHFKNIERKIVGCNDAFCEMHGKTRSQIVNREATDILTLEQAREVSAMDQELLKDDGISSISAELIRGERTYLVKNSTFRDQANKAAGIASIMFDVTDQKRIESNLRESEEKFRAICDTVPLGIFIVDNSGGYRYVNGSFVGIIGDIEEEILKQNWFQNVLFEDKGRIYGKWMESLQHSDMSFDEKVRFQKSNGDQVWIHWRMTRLKFNDKEELFLGVAEDITERLKVKSQLIRAKEKAEEGDRLKSAFLRNLSHEVRTPINGITGFCTVLEDPDLGLEERLKYVDIIKTSSSQLLSVLGDVLDMSMVETKQIELKEQEIDLKDFMKEIFLVFQKNGSGLEFQLLNSEKKDCVQVSVDNIKLRQILLNLLDNAFKFTEEGFVEFGYRIIKGYLEFQVKDSGIGIPEKDVHHVFDRFRQVDYGKNRKYEGNGLGLSIAKAYVELLGGKLKVMSTEGVGSSFTFTIPYIPVERN